MEEQGSRLFFEARFGEWPSSNSLPRLLLDMTRTVPHHQHHYLCFPVPKQRRSEPEDQEKPGQSRDALILFFNSFLNTCTLPTDLVSISHGPIYNNLTTARTSITRKRPCVQNASFSGKIATSKPISSLYGRTGPFIASILMCMWRCA